MPTVMITLSYVHKYVRVGECMCVNARMLTFVAQCKYHMLTKQLPFELKLQANQQQLPLATG